MALFCSFLDSSSLQSTPNNNRDHEVIHITDPKKAIVALLSIKNDHMDGLSDQLMEKKIDELRAILQQSKDPLEGLLMIDDLQRLGIDHHFHKVIKSILRCEYRNLCSGNGGANGSMYQVALSFRLLREHGYHVSPDVFNRFKDNDGRFGESLSKDIEGLMGLYEASKLAIEGEKILDEANDYARDNLNALIESMEPGSATIVKHALEHPFHMTLPRFNIKHHLKNLHRSNMQTKVMEELAKLEFNHVQSMHQGELKYVTKWWRDLGLSQELKFVRDQPIKWFMWSLAILSNPQLSLYRIELTKPIALIYVIDDIFDVYGTPDELSMFTEAINRWNLLMIDQLPSYMKTCFMALFRITNEMADLVLQEHGWNPISSLKKAWADLCNAFLLEGKWLRGGHLPKAEEYLRNGVISTGVHVVLIHVFFLLGHGITEESVDRLENMPGVISSPATLLRLWDDLGNAKDEKQEGYDGSYVECYMREKRTSVETAKEHVKYMIKSEWRKLNREYLTWHPFSPSFTKAILNSARMIQVMYSYDENQRLPALGKHITSLLKEHIPL